MFSKVVLLLLPGLLFACVQVKPKVEFPCKVCQRLYNTTCEGLDPNDIESCYTAEQAKVKYRLGLPPNSDRIFIPADACTMSLKCPGSSQLYNMIDKVSQIPTAWCMETGPDAGIWNAGLSPIVSFQIGGWVDGCRDPNWKPDFSKWFGNHDGEEEE